MKTQSSASARNALPLTWVRSPHAAHLAKGRLGSSVLSSPSAEFEGQGDHSIGAALGQTTMAGHRGNVRICPSVRVATQATDKTDPTAVQSDQVSKSSG